MATFVLEIGSEELPARFLAGEEAELAARFTAALQEASVEHGALRTMSTPRRAIVIIEDVNRVQQEREEEVAGPPVRVAFAADGKPTKALEGFARTNGVSVDDVYRITTEKGEYVAVRKRIGGAAVHRQQALVLINEDRATSEDVVKLAHYVRQRVGAKFDVWLQPEVRFIGTHGEVNAEESIA